MGKPATKQIAVSDVERRRIQLHVQEMVVAARTNHDNRIQRFRRYYRMWRGLPQTQGNMDGSAFQYPMLKWIVFGQWARIMQSLLGDDAEIVAQPSGPTDEGEAKKAGAYMTWRFFRYMEATIGLTTWVFRSLIFGRGHAEIIYEMETYWERSSVDEVNMEQLEANKNGDMALQYIVNGDGTVDYECVCYDGPRLRPLWPSQLIVPAQDDVSHIDQFEWVCRRDRVTPEQLLAEERRGKVVGIQDNWNIITSQANERPERDFLWDNEQFDRSEAEGVQRASIMGNRDSLERWRWYGKWRFLKGKQDGSKFNLKAREMVEREILVTHLPEAQLTVGIEDLRGVYPKMQKRHPIVDMGGVKDGSYWTPGLGELTEELQNESSINFGLIRKAGMLSVGPVILYKPSSNFDPQTFEYKPSMAIPSEDPSGVKVVNLQADLTYPEFMQQLLKTLAELTTGVTDQSLGRVSDRPNAPQTASGQAMLLQEGNTRVALDMSMIREDVARAINYVWALDREYSSPEVYFQVTGEDAPFDVDKGFGKMTAEERNHPYSFDLKFATSYWSREAKKQAMLQIYGLSMQNPVVQTNPRALWVLLNRIWESFGEEGFKDVLPEPPTPETPLSPKIEWVKMLQGDEVEVNPLDDDQAHIIDHRRRLDQEMQLDPERRDPGLEKGAAAHILQHQQQMRQKQLLQQLAQVAVQHLTQNGTGAPPGGPQPQPSPQMGAPQQGAPPANGVPGTPPAAAPAPAGPPQGPIAPADQRPPQ